MIQKRKRKLTRSATKKSTKKQKNKAVVWKLRLYIAGNTPRSNAALANLTRICEEHLANRYAIELINLLEKPSLASGDQIVAVPTLVRKLPVPIRQIIGDLSNTEKVLVGLDLRPLAK